VSEAQQDGLATYVYDANPGDADFYSIAGISGVPGTVVGVTTRGFVEKSDVGSRSIRLQLRSGSAIVQSGNAVLSTQFQWVWRTDLIDPSTLLPWTAAGVNNVQIGPIVTS
jgi:hypothetical protein